MLAHVRTYALAVAPWLLAVAHAQPASGSADGGMPMADYLGLLEQIAPAAREGAEAYLRANQQRCGRVLTTQELRRAMAHDSGDRVLMGMIRASQLRDTKTLAALAQDLSCGGPK